MNFIKNKFKDMLIYFMLLSILCSCNDGMSSTGKYLKSAEGQKLHLPYAKMALTAKYIGPAIENEDYYNWGVSPIKGKDKKYIFLVVDGQRSMEWKGGVLMMQKLHILYQIDLRDLLNM